MARTITLTLTEEEFGDVYNEMVEESMTDNDSLLQKLCNAYDRAFVWAKDDPDRPDPIDGVIINEEEGDSDEEELIEEELTAQEDGSVAKRLAVNGLYVCAHNAWKDGDEEQYESIHSLASRVNDDTATEDDWAEVMEYLIDEYYEGDSDEEELIEDRESNMTDISKRIMHAMIDIGFMDIDADVVGEIAVEVYDKLCEQKDPGCGIMNYVRMDRIIGEIIMDRFYN